jgi:hypothetical protein
METSSDSSLFKLARAGIRAVCPPLYRWISFLRNEGRYRRVERLVARQYGSRVAAGPFAGMLYLDRASGSVLAPKLLGSYEAEISNWIKTILARSYPRIIDIGSAEGYYAVGFARQIPKVRIFAFDSDPAAQAACRELAVLNGVMERLEVLGFCDQSALGQVLCPGAFIVCDCEGAEEDLLDPSTLHELENCDLLVETHDFARPGVCALLEKRFKATHIIESADIKLRDPSDYPQVSFLKKSYRALALNEIRFAGQRWLMMWRRNGKTQEA